MNFNLSGIGAEPKKIGILVALLAVAAYFYFSGRDSGLPASAPRTVAPEVSQVAAPVQPQVARPVTHARTTGKGFDTGLREFRPSLKFKDIDPGSVDPTLHLDLLAKLRQVEPENGSRSLFEISAAPVEIAKLKEPAKIKPTPVGPIAPAAPATPPGPPPAPKAPPIPLKFYGFVDPAKADNKRAFFLDGEDIVIASEGETIKKRYKVIRIGVNSAVLEDTQFKSNNQQTLPLEAELAG